MAKILKKRDKLMKGDSLAIYSKELRKMSIYDGAEVIQALMHDLEKEALLLAPGTNKPQNPNTARSYFYYLFDFISARHNIILY